MVGKPSPYQNTGSNGRVCAFGRARVVCFEEKRFVCFRQALRVGNAFAPEGKSSMITGYGLLDVNQFRKSAYFDCSKNNKSFLPHSCMQPLKP